METNASEFVIQITFIKHRNCGDPMGAYDI